MSVSDWFSQFCSNIRIDRGRRELIALRAARIVGQLNIDFRGIDSKTTYRFYVGSYGRNTAITSVSDVDLLYELPITLFSTYNDYAYNGQSALLSAVRNSIKKTYSDTNISGDGQVVVIRFSDGISFDLLPAFDVGDSYLFADSNGGGTWKSCKPKAELSAFAERNAACNANLVELGRMVRAWRDCNNVPMSGMLIDTLAYQFIGTWEYRQKSYLYYDWMTRDFFQFLAACNTSQSYWLAPGSGSYVYRSGLFEYKARQAELRAREAIDAQAHDYDYTARQKYREIYGTDFPAL